MIGTPLLEEIRAGRLEPVELLESERATLAKLMEAIRRKEVVVLFSSEGQSARRLPEGFATQLLQFQSNNPSLTVPILIEAPSTLAQLRTFVLNSAEIDGGQAIVFIDMNAVAADMSASGRTAEELATLIAPLLLTPSIPVFITATQHAHDDVLARLEPLLGARRRAIDDLINFKLSVREPPAPEQNLFFQITRANAKQAIDDMLAAPFGRRAEFLAECLNQIVRSARRREFGDREEQTLLGTLSLLVFATALPFKAGYEHALIVDVTGNRYRMDRGYSLPMD